MLAGQLREGLTQHFSSLCLQHLPGAWDPKTAAPGVGKPSQHAAVFTRAVREVGGLEVGDPALMGREASLDMEEGSQAIISYSCVRDRLGEGDLRLI